MWPEYAGLEHIRTGAMHRTGLENIVGALLAASGNSMALAAPQAQALDLHPAAAQALGAALSRAIRPQPSIEQFQGTEPRRQILGFGVTPFAANQSANVTAQPQIPFRPERLITAVPAVTFSINEIFIGQRAQFVTPGAVPADAFVATAVDTILKLDTASTAQNITLQVTNLTGAGASFQAMFIGTTCVQ
jgi:hypothetical protein